MIFFLTTGKHSYTIARYLESYGQDLRSCIRPLSYGRLFRSDALASGTYVFADLERLCPRNLGRASHIWERLAVRSDCRLLNRPGGALRRYELLRTLWDRGINQFRAFRLTEDISPLRFPVFLRGEDDHKGSHGPLLENAILLRRAVRQSRWRRRRANLITEFCDTADAEGIYRKFSAFCVGTQIVARHLFLRRDWMVKSTALTDAKFLDEELRYVEGNPHREPLRQIFAAARIDYGRIDYAVLEGKIQVWEINTNPMIMTSDDRHFTGREAVQTVFSQRFATALRELDVATQENGPATIRIDPSAARQVPPWRSLRERVWHYLYV